VILPDRDLGVVGKSTKSSGDLEVDGKILSLTHAQRFNLHRVVFVWEQSIDEPIARRPAIDDVEVHLAAVAQIADARPITESRSFELASREVEKDLDRSPLQVLR
jgi:hypothetical protein